MLHKHFQLLMGLVLLLYPYVHTPQLPDVFIRLILSCDNNRFGSRDNFRSLYATLQVSSIVFGNSTTALIERKEIKLHETTDAALTLAINMGPWVKLFYVVFVKFCLDWLRSIYADITQKPHKGYDSSCNKQSHPGPIVCVCKF